MTIHARYLLTGLTLCTLLVFTALPTAGHADSLVIPDITTMPEKSQETIERPARAMTMDQVRDEFGEPLKIVGPVGDPPITRWVYDKFTVHFERQYVIHSSVNKHH
ncbi:MAG: hypothetical protein PVJ39_18860 [Gammaproteobacteria bacterium]|jgi:hypothetical protein